MIAPRQTEHVQLANSTDDAIVVNDLTKRYGQFAAVDNITFSVPEGRVIGFVGPNGSGKSTTIRMLLGLVKPTGGTGRVFGQSIDTPSGFLDRVGAMIEAPALYKGLSGEDNLRYFATLRDVPRRRVTQVLEIVGLHGRRADKVSSYSLGMKQRLGIAIALLGDPDLLVLDEPTNGLDPAGIIEIRELLKEIGRSGKTVFVSSHLLSEVEKLAQHVVLINRGTLVYSGQLSDLMDTAIQRIRVTPENPEDVSRLYVSFEATNHPVSLEGPSLLVGSKASLAPRLNRIANQQGIFLRELSHATESLEEIFIRMTGSEHGDR